MSVAQLEVINNVLAMLCTKVCFEKISSGFYVSEYCSVTILIGQLEVIIVMLLHCRVMSNFAMGEKL